MSDPLQLSEELRHGSGAFLRHRRIVALLSLTTMSSLALVTLYQLGILKHLPQPPLPLLKTKKVHASRQAYSLLEVPDAVLGLGSYAATLALAAMGGKDRATTQPWIPLALAGKALADAAEAGKLMRDSWVKHHAFSIYSLVAAVATAASLPQVLPESIVAFGLWRRRRAAKQKLGRRISETRGRNFHH